VPILEWNDSLLLGVDQFDEHHRHLVSLINSANDTLQSGSDHEAVARLLDELVDYATYHFAAEEFWMQQFGYPRLEEHAREHEEFCIRVVEQELLFDAGHSDVLPGLIVFLSAWLVEHIQRSDGDYGEYAKLIGASHDSNNIF
jgi:hemerythrin